MADEPQAPAGNEPSAAGSPAAGAATPQPQGQPAAPAATPSATPSQPAGEGEIRGRARAHINRVQAENARLRAELGAARRSPAPAAPAQPPDREADVLREEIFQLFPNLRKLSTLDPEQLERVLTDVAPRQEALQRHYFGNMGRQTLRSIETKVKDEYGDATSDHAVRMHQAYFMDWLGADEDRTARYEESDPTLVDEFWKEVTTGVHDPIRSKATEAARQQAQRVSGLPPFGGRGSSAMRVPAPSKTPATPENVHDRAWERLVEQRASGQ